ncbi:MAG TPA: HNH endonuclease [Lacunisphaera sp.]|nr:HNH endonuclease [Lacunisphaera sp.]
MGKITYAHYSMAYTLGREVYLDRLRLTDALDQLEAIGMNRASASFSIGNLRQMLNGAAYHRAMKIDQTRHLLVSIQHDDGLPTLKKAVAAFAGHLAYLRGKSRSRLPGLSSLLQEFTNRLGETVVQQDAIDDFVDKPEGSIAPDRAKKIGTHFKRDPKIRAYVVRRARGRCEHCGKVGFLTQDGVRFIETHHVIGLAKQGPDTPRNVIALCADHHREAHFGVDAAKLEELFLAKLHDLEKP